MDESTHLAAEALPARLTKARTVRGMSRADLATASKLARTTIFNLENGKTSPSIDVIEKLAIALGVDAGWLGFGPDEEPRAAAPTETAA